jgi:hypothetical protein
MVRMHEEAISQLERDCFIAFAMTALDTMLRTASKKDKI